jgi:hypothetical protein
MSTHTKEPWSVGGPTGCINQLKINPSIGVVYGAGEEIMANARLIAAAPDLLAALQLICSEYPARRDGMDNQILPVGIKAGRAAIAKATGTKS